MSKAKTMSRSRNQIANSYSPESFFTFEGGSGACIAHSVPTESIELVDATKEQIFERINELGRAWFDAAMGCRDADATQPRVSAPQCVDPKMLDNTRSDFQAPGIERVHLCRPSSMGYTPAPLSFVCRACGLFRDFTTLRELDAAISELSTTKCRKHDGPCDWEQLDVIFVHWSGNWTQPFPGQYQWSDVDAKVVKRRDKCICGHEDFRLNRRAAGIGDWFFECAKCDKPLSPKWRQNDEASLRFIGPAFTEARRTEVSMQAAPYRASSVYYVKSDLFIDFKDGGRDLLTRLRPGREDALKDFVAKQYGFGISEVTDEEVEAACAGRPDCEKEWLEFQSSSGAIKTGEAMAATVSEPIRSGILTMLATAYEGKKRIINDLRRRAILLPKISLPVPLLERIRHRQVLFASKFDPFRLAVEHATLDATRLAVESRVNGKKPYVSFTRLDEDLAPETDVERDALQAETQVALTRLGLADMGLIREFDLCRFSFGYSRMEGGPVLHDKRGMNMPVRLNMFPPVMHNSSSKNPIYVVQQGNEAIYVKLKPELVQAWLADLDCPDMFSLSGDEKIGAGILACSQQMSPFLDKLPESDTPPTYFYLYTLLHSYSHLLMKHMSEYSGLDMGSLGEYIFPADLAFVVYRSGTTMDLGNLSAMWRNSGTAMLNAMLSLKATQCGTGSLCSHRGGACPDCIMVPETSCVASNKLLSRSVLRGTGKRPKFDTRPEGIRGFFEYTGE